MFFPKLPRNVRSTVLPDLDAFGRRRVLNPILASTINARAIVAERLSKITAAPPLGIADTPGGRCLYLQDAEPFPAALTGSTSPYTFHEVYSTPSGAWELKPNGRTGTAIEVNGVAGLGA